MANHIRVFTAIIFSQLVVFYFGLQMDVSLTEILLTVGVASLFEMIYHVVLARKIGATISFKAFWKNCEQLFRKNSAVFSFLVLYHIIFKGGDFMSFIIWQVFFVVLVTTIILASNDVAESR